jgi:hypothetical protein
MIQKLAMNKILGFETISDRICKLRLKGKFYNITLINIYSPTEDKEDEIKEQFYEELQRTQDRVPKHNVIIILGDMNSKLGKEKVFSQVIGCHTLHNASNENGEMVANYAIGNCMYLISTNFQHKKIHIGKWTYPDHQTIKHIDNVMVSKENVRLIHHSYLHCYIQHRTYIQKPFKAVTFIATIDSISICLLISITAFYIAQNTTITKKQLQHKC